MKKIHHSLIPTEQRLITLFVGGAFLFLVIFEGFFIVSRSLFENEHGKDMFKNEMQRIENRQQLSGFLREKGRGPIFSGINSITISSDGTILGGQLTSDFLVEEAREILDKDLLKNLPVKQTISQEGLLFYKMPIINTAQYRIFIGKSGYPFEDILRDILRLLIMDILILLPFYFMGRYFVRETLAPIGDNIDTMNHFIHDAGHELKTPLAIMSGNLQILRDTKTKDIELIKESIHTLESMNSILDGLLELTSLKIPKELIGILPEKAINDEIEKYKDIIEARKIRIEKNIKSGIKLIVDPKHFSLLFSNLFKNAITYNKHEGGQIIINWSGKILSIEDTGIGISEENKEKIWERFYRVDRSGVHPGSGIGLAIVERIVKLYNWNIDIKSTLGIGTTFSIITKK